jgi:DNA-binding NarL/FixJ family response regulator
MIRVATCDPHAAVRAGLEAILRDTPGLVPVGSADRRGLQALLYRTDPDVVIVPDATICLAVRGRARVVVYDRFDAVVEAAFARAAALVDREAVPSELVAAIRGERELPRITPRLQRRAAQLLGGTDRAILAMGLAGTPDRDIAKVVGLAPPALAARKAAIVSGAVRALDGASELHAG